MPYVLFKFDDEQNHTIQTAMQIWMNATCVVFKKRQDEEIYVSIVGNGYGICSSTIGYLTYSQVNIGYSCISLGMIVHELGHILGRYHEHSRPDRDQYITIYTWNILYYARQNFDINTDIPTTLPYDYDSIMHYEGLAYSSNGMPTIMPVHPNATIGQRCYLSTLDIETVNKMYKCNVSTLLASLMTSLMTSPPPLTSLITSSPLTSLITSPPQNFCRPSKKVEPLSSSTYTRSSLMISYTKYCGHIYNNCWIYYNATCNNFYAYFTEVRRQVTLS